MSCLLPHELASFGPESKHNISIHCVCKTPDRCGYLLTDRGERAQNIMLIHQISCWDNLLSLRTTIFRCFARAEVYSLMPQHSTYKFINFTSLSLHFITFSREYAEPACCSPFLLHTPSSIIINTALGTVREGKSFTSFTPRLSFI